METAELQPHLPPKIVLYFLSLALQQEFEKEIYFYIQFLLISLSDCLIWWAN